MDAIKFLFAFLVIFVPFLLATKLGIWVWAWVGVLIWFIGMEIYGVFFSKKKKTISRQFWEFKDEHPVQAAFCLFGMIVFWAYLILHLWLRW